MTRPFGAYSASHLVSTVLEGEMDGKRTTSTSNGDPFAARGYLPANMFRQLCEVLSAHKGEGLSTRGVDVLHEICYEARRRGVSPEQLIARVKEEIRSISRLPADREQEDRRVDEAVTRCIECFFSAAPRQY